MNCPLCGHCPPALHSPSCTLQQRMTQRDVIAAFAVWDARATDRDRRAALEVTASLVGRPGYADALDSHVAAWAANRREAA